MSSGFSCPSVTVCFRSSLPMLLNTMSKRPLPFTSCLNSPFSLVRNMATGFSVLPALNTRTVAKGSASPSVSSINTPFTVVWAIITCDVIIITIITKKTLTCFIFLFFCFYYLKNRRCKGMMISLSFKMDFDDFLDFFRRISLCSPRSGAALGSGAKVQSRATLLWGLTPATTSSERLYFGA